MTLDEEGKEFTVTVGGESALPCGQVSSTVCLSACQWSVLSATNRGGSWKLNRGVAAKKEGQRGEEEEGS